MAIFVTYSCWTGVHRYAKNTRLQAHGGYIGSFVHWMEETEDIQEAKVYY